MALLRRTLSAVLILTVVGAVMFVLPSLVSMAVLLALAVAGVLEFYGILRNAGIPAFRILGTIAGVSMLTASYYSLNMSVLATSATPPEIWRESPLLVLSIIVFAIFVRQFPQKNNPQPLPTISCTMLGLVYVPFLIMFLLFLAFRWTPTSPLDPLSPTARWLILYLVVVVKASDIGAYFTGSFIGRHKLFPRISPGKTWEGLAGGLVSGVAASVLFARLAHPAGAPAGTTAFGRLTLDTFDVWFLGAFLASVGVLGDLVESLLKRSAGMKDSGQLFPGMGGILDVLDSLLFTAPALYFYLRWFAHVS